MEIYFERIKPLFESTGLSDAELERAIGIPAKTIHKWNTRFVKSYDKYISQIAEYFDVNPKYLRGLTDQKEKTAPQEDGLNDDQRYIINAIRNMTEAQAKVFRGLIEEFLATR